MMNINKQKFFRFPKTPHIQGSITKDDDSIISYKDFLCELKPEYNVIIQEKMDGTNVSIHFEEKMIPVLQKRSGLIGKNEHVQYQMFRNWVYNKLEVLWNILHKKYCLFGEWLWCKHALKYDRLPDYFLAFDIYDKKNDYFLSTHKANNILNKNINTVPIIWQGSSKNLPDYHNLFEKSNFGSEIMEGIYIRVEDSQRVIKRYKYRRNTFEPGREDFHKKIKKNELK